MERRYVTSLVLFYESIKISQIKYIRKRKKEEERTRDLIIAVLDVCGQSDGWSLDLLPVWMRAWATEFDRLYMFRIAGMSWLFLWEGICTVWCSTKNESSGWMGEGACFWSLWWFMDPFRDMTEERNAFRLACELPTPPLIRGFLTRKEDIDMIKNMTQHQQELLVSLFPWLLWNTLIKTWVLGHRGNNSRAHSAHPSKGQSITTSSLQTNKTRKCTEVV